MPSGKALPPDEAERVRVALREIVKGYPKQEAAAKRLGMSQQSLSHILNGGAVSYTTARAVANYIGADFDALVLGRSSPDSRPMLRNMPGWDEVVREAMQRYPRVVTPEIVEVLGEDKPRRAPTHLTAEVIMLLASAWATALPTIEDETAKAKRELEELRSPPPKRGKK